MLARDLEKRISRLKEDEELYPIAGQPSFQKQRSKIFRCDLPNWTYIADVDQGGGQKIVILYKQQPIKP
jgi:hypothetical protein